jgi:hypothetical protein
VPSQILVFLQQQRHNTLSQTIVHVRMSRQRKKSCHF